MHQGAENQRAGRLVVAAATSVLLLASAGTALAATRAISAAHPVGVQNAPVAADNAGSAPTVVESRAPAPTETPSATPTGLAADPAPPPPPAEHSAGPESPGAASDPAPSEPATKSPAPKAEPTKPAVSEPTKAPPAEPAPKPSAPSLPPPVPTAVPTVHSPATNAGMVAYAAYPSITGPRSSPTINRSGRQVISAPGVYSGWNVTNGNIDIQSNGGKVILEDFVVDARGTKAAGAVWVRNGFTSQVEIRYGRVIGGGNVGSTAVVTGVNGYVHNLEISNSEDGIRPFSGSRVHANWIHSLYSGVGSHNDTLQLIGTEHDVDISQNRFDAPYKHQNAAVFIKADVGNIDRINVHNNYIYGGGYSVYVYDSVFRTTNVTLDYNVFIRGSAHYGQLVTRGLGLVSKVGNKWDDGSLIWG